MNTIAVDLGSSNIRIAKNGEVVLDEPSVVAIAKRSEACIASGTQAKKMQSRINPSIELVQPFSGGMIINYSAFAEMFKSFMRKAGIRRKLFRRQNMIISIPESCTQVETRAIQEVATQCGIRNVRFIHTPIAAALGTGLDIQNSRAKMVINIGGSRTSIAVICLGGIVEGKNIHIGCETLDADVVRFFRDRCHVKIGLPTAEHVRMNLSTLLATDDNSSYDVELDAMNVITLRPDHVKIPEKEIIASLAPTMFKITDAIAEIFDAIGPELYSDIMEDGVWFSGGGALQNALAENLSQKFSIKFKIVDKPCNAVVRGAVKAAEMPINATDYNT